VHVSLGPRPDVAAAFTQDPRGEYAPGAISITTDVGAFYNETRAKLYPLTYSLITFFVPMAVIAAAFGLADWMLEESSWAHYLGLAERDLVPPLPITTFCDTIQRSAPLQATVVAGTIRFAATHVALLTICIVAYGAGVSCAHNVLNAHEVFRVFRRKKLIGWAISLGAPFVAGVIVFEIANSLLRDHIESLSFRLFPISTIDAKCQIPYAVTQLNNFLISQVRIGTFAVAMGISSLSLAAAVVSYRFETHDINGTWSHPYVLRNKLHTLLTLFFIGSIMLVSTSVALNSRMDWWNGVLDVVRHATSSNSPDTTALTFDSIERLRGSVAYFVGGVGSLVLTTIFVPALFKHTREIELAGACHGYYDAQQPNPPVNPPVAMIVVAGWDTVQAWKAKHGLQMSYGDLAGSAMAAFAPILSGNLIDLTKFFL
jgi:hypothetical protein